MRSNRHKNKKYQDCESRCCVSIRFGVVYRSFTPQPTPGTGHVAPVKPSRLTTIPWMRHAESGSNAVQFMEAAFILTMGLSEKRNSINNLVDWFWLTNSSQSSSKPWAGPGPKDWC